MYDTLASSLFINRMRQTFVSIIALFAIVLTARASDLGKDGFNYYKDYLRARTDEVADSPYDRTVLYYFRNPLNVYPEIPPIQDYGKRTANLFKNHMLNKDGLGESRNKRTSKTGLSLLMQSKQDVRPTEDSHYCLYGK